MMFHTFVIISRTLLEPDTYIAGSYEYLVN